VDQDGTCFGPDMQLQQTVAAITQIPLLLGGGFAEINQTEIAPQNTVIAGVSIGAALHNSRLDLTALKTAFATAAVPLPIRSVPTGAKTPFTSVPQTRTKQKIGLIDYGMGNQQSPINALEHLWATVVLGSELEQLHSCDLLALPGVGSFPKGMEELQKRGFDSWLKQWREEGKPLFVICLGM